MKTTRNALFALILLAAGTAAAASAQVSVGAGIHIGPSGRASVDLGFFYDNLAPYGNWIQRPSYGWVWTPTDVSTSWRPYEDGHWVWTDQGWTWITDEPYGWATYHYGRWYDDPEIGWAWVPGDEWGPSWVSWQEGSDYIGWAPLPPGVDISVGYNSGYNGYGGGYAYGINPAAYVFVPERNFLSVSLASYIVPQVQVTAFFGRTRNYTSYRREGDRFYNQGIPVDRVQRYVGRSVPRYQLADLQTQDYRQPRARITGNTVQIFRPQVQRSVQVAPPASRPAARRAVVSAEQFQANHPNRAVQRQQMQTQQPRQQVRQPRNQPGAQVQPYQPRTYNPQAQGQDQNGRRQVNPQPRTERQVKPEPPSRPTYPPSYGNQNDRQRPPQSNRQVQPPPQSQQGNRQVRPPQNDRGQQNQGQNRGQQRGKGKQRDRNQNQDQDPNRPPVR